MDTEEPIKRKKGPKPGPPTNKYTVLLPPELGEWGKEQPGGLSELIRRFLQEAKEHQEKSGSERG